MDVVHEAAGLVPVMKPKRRRRTSEKWSKKEIKLSKDAIR